MLKNIPKLQVCKIIIREDPDLDQRVYNCPAASQVAAIWLEDDHREITDKDIVVYSHAGYSYDVWYYYGCYDPLQYALLFPYGDTGWHEGIERNENYQGKSVCNEFIADINKIMSIEELLKKEQEGMHIKIKCLYRLENYSIICQIFM